MEKYPIHCFMPNDRQLMFNPMRILQEINLSETDSSYISSSDSYKIELVAPDSAAILVNLTNLSTRFSFTYYSRLCFLHEKDLRLIQFYSTEDSIPDEYLSQIYQEKLQENLSIRYINESLGYGLFTIESIPLGRFIGEYVGLVKSTSDSSNSGYKMHYPNCDGGYEIDAREYGNIIRFINHSEDPNLEFRFCTYRGLSHVYVVSIREIQPQSQLTVNYSSNYWTGRGTTPETLI